MNRKIAIIGGGPAGMMAAASAAAAGVQAVIYEQNNILGKKLRITGKGRCNVTNNCTVEEFFSEVTKNHKFLYSAVNRFTPSDTISFFESLGVPLKTERGRRVFPVSDKASDIANALETHIKKNGTEIRREKVLSVEKTENTVVGLTTASGFASFSEIIIATGGVSYPGCGSTGDGLKFADTLGISVVPPRPSLVPVITRENTSHLAGLSLKNIRLDLEYNQKVIFSEIGEMLFTHFGLSGPLVLSASARMNSGRTKDYIISLDLKPALRNEQLDKRLISDLGKYAQRDFINSLHDLLPRTLIPEIVHRSGISERKKSGEITKEERLSLAAVLKRLSYTPISFRPIEEAIITSGGINVTEINPKTMMSKKLDGLYFAGELIDVDAYTGGYNLQIAFSTGHAAGSAAAMHLLENI